MVSTEPWTVKFPFASSVTSFILDLLSLSIPVVSLSPNLSLHRTFANFDDSDNDVLFHDADVECWHTVRRGWTTSYDRLNQLSRSIQVPLLSHRFQKIQTIHLISSHLAFIGSWHTFSTAIGYNKTWSCRWMMVTRILFHAPWGAWENLRIQMSFSWWSVGNGDFFRLVFCFANATVVPKS